MFISRSELVKLAEFFGKDSIPATALEEEQRRGGDCLFFITLTCCFVLPRKVAA